LAPQKIETYTFPPYTEHLEKINRAQLVSYTRAVLQSQHPIHQRHLYLQISRSLDPRSPDYMYWINNVGEVYANCKPLFTISQFHRISQSPPRRVRNWSDLQIQPDMKSDDIWDWVPLTDFEGGILAVVKEAISIHLFDIPRQVAAAMGLGRIGLRKQLQVYDRIIHLLGLGLLDLKGEWLRLPTNLIMSSQRDINREAAVRLREPFQKRRSKAARANAIDLDLPIQAAPYQLAEALMDEKLFLLNQGDGWVRGGFKRKSQLSSIVSYPFYPKSNQYQMVGLRKIDYWDYYDFPEKLVDLEILGIFSQVVYDYQTGRFYHDGLFGLLAKPPRSRRQVMFRVWRDPADGQFYGRVRSHNTRNYHLYDKWAQGRSFMTARLDLSLGDLTGSTFRPVKCERIGAKSELTEIGVDGQLEAFVRDKELRTIVTIVEVEQPIHLDELRRRIAHSLESKSVTSLVKNTTDQLLEWGIEQQKLVVFGDYVRLFGAVLEPVVRDRSMLPNVSRKLDYVLDPEIKAAVTQLQAAGVELTEKNAPLVVGKFLGVKRPRGKQAGRILAHLKK
ncbi:MAG: hypothetical protein AAF902_24360, partial [Chloroflexota bacterium]